jgi:hypothetical protein
MFPGKDPSKYISPLTRQLYSEKEDIDKINYVLYNYDNITGGKRSVSRKRKRKTSKKKSKTNHKSKKRLFKKRISIRKR